MGGTYPVGREAVLHSEPTGFHPEAEAHPAVDQAHSSVPSAKRYVIGGIVLALVVLALAVYLILK